MLSEVVPQLQSVLSLSTQTKENLVIILYIMIPFQGANEGSR